MTDTTDHHASPEHEPEASDESLAEFLAEYVDLYSVGAVAGPWQHMASQSDSPPELLRELETIAFVNSVYDETTIPSEFGDFRILREIGRGGMGIVYEARQHSLERRVALKVMPARLLSSPRAVARFTREARAAAGLNHPNIVPVYSMGVEGGTPYYTMELSSGESLQGILERVRKAGGDQTPMAFRHSPGKLSSMLRRLFGKRQSHGTGARLVVDPSSPSTTEDAQPKGVEAHHPSRGLGATAPALALDSREGHAYFVQMARVFAGVADGLQHAHEHGVIHRDLKPSNLVLDVRGQLRVLDFGVARVEGLGRLTFSDERVGTPLYMSPEQAQDPPGPLGPGTDVYGAGATMYEMLALTPPLRGRSTEETLRKIVDEDPPSPRRLNGHVPRDLETIVLRCLRKDPRKRYGSAEALAADLRNFAEGKPITARPLPLPERVARRAWQSRKWILRTVGALAVIAGIAVLATQHLQRAHEQRVEKFQTAIQSGLRSTLRHQLRITDPRMITRGVDFVAVSRRDPSQPIRSRVFDGSNHVYYSAPGALEVGLALVHVEEDYLEEAEAYARAALKIFDDEPIGRFYLGRVLLLRGKLSSALHELDLVRRARPDFVPALTVRAYVLELQGSESAPSAWNEAERLARESPGSWGSEWLEAYRALWDRRWNDAAEALGRMQTRFPEGAEPYLGARLESLMWTGIARSRSGSPEIAVEDFRAANYTWSGSLEPVLFLGQARYLSGYDAEAETLFETVLESPDRRGASSRRELIAAVIGVYKDLGDDDAVARWVERLPEDKAKSLTLAEALALQGRFDEAHRLVRNTARAGGSLPVQLTLANVLILQGNVQEAIHTLEAALRAAPQDPRIRLGIGVCYSCLGRLDEADSWIREAIAIRKDLAPAYYNLGRVRERQGKLDAALEAYLSAVQLKPYDPLTINSLGALYDRRGDLYLAREHYKEAVRVSPKFAAARFNLAWLLHRERRYSEAAREYRRAMDLGIENDFIHGLLGSAILRSRKGFWWVSDKLFEEAIARKPDYATNYFDLGVYWIWTGENAKAVTRFQEYLRMEPEDSAAWSHLGLALANEQKTHEAIDALRRAIGVDRRNVEAHSRLASLYLQDGTIPEDRHSLRRAIVDLEDAHRLDPTSEAIRTLLRRYRAALEPALASHASIDDALAGLPVEVAVESGDRWLLLPESEDGLERPQRAYLRGRLRQLAADFEGALGEFQAAAALDPSRPEPYLRSASCLMELGELERAEGLLRGALGDSALPNGVANHDAPWDMWIDLALRARGGHPEAILRSFPARSAVAEDRVHGHARDILWLVERLASDEAIRINCGGKDFATEGFTWSQDRFSLGGEPYYLADLDALYAGRDEAALYQTERYFFADQETESGTLAVGYRVPLPSGTYRVSLHFVEGHWKERGKRVFDVLLNRETEISDYEPLAVGFGNVDILERDVRVEDRVLRVDFRRVEENPKLSAFEIRRLR